MPIPVGGSGNVDGEGGTTNGGMCYPALVDSWWLYNLLDGDWVRERLEPTRVQPGGTLRGAWAACPQFMDITSLGLPPTTLESEPELAKLTNDADDHGADDA